MSQRFKVDENLPPFVAAHLRAAGHDAVTVADQRLRGTGDSALAAICSRERRVLVTLDLDFADTRAFPPGSGPGFVVFRPDRENRAEIERAAALLVRGLETDPVDGALWIVESRRVRVRDSGP